MLLPIVGILLAGMVGLFIAAVCLPTGEGWMLVGVILAVSMAFLGGFLGFTGAQAIGTGLPKVTVVTETHRLAVFQNGTDDRPLYASVWGGHVMYNLESPDGPQPQFPDGTSHTVIKPSADGVAWVVEYHQEFQDGWNLLFALTDYSTAYQFQLPTGSYILCNGSIVASDSSACHAG